MYWNEISDWAVMELMTWNYGLSFEEGFGSSTLLAIEGPGDSYLYSSLGGSLLSF